MNLPPKRQASTLDQSGSSPLYSGIHWFLNGARKNALAGLTDAAITALAYVVALALRTGLRFDTIEAEQALLLCLLVGAFQVVANIVADVYWREWHYVSLKDAVALLKASVVAGAAILIVDLTAPGAQRNLPLSTIPIGALLTAGALLGYRLRDRTPAILRAAVAGPGVENIVIIGAGEMGQLLARDLEGPSSPYHVRAFIDPDPRKTGNYIRGHRVEGTLRDIPSLVRRFDASVVAIALPDLSGQRMQEIVAACDPVDVQIRKVSGLRDSLSGASIGLERIEPEDLLRRSSVRVDAERSRALLSDSSVMITGAAGSIGSELAKQVLEYAPSRLLLVDLDESRLFDLAMQLGHADHVSIRLLDIRDRAAVQRLFRSNPTDTVFHAAALKHAPLLETHVIEAIDTNVFGTTNIAEAALATHVGRFVFIGTDKAVAPQGTMGATKRLGELLIRSVASGSSTTFSVVRFGNVFGSRGSVVPLFLSQIESGGPVTVTDADATRYFMTISEAAGLVLEAAALAQNGDVFMLEMGDPIPIVELARRLIRARGLRVGRDIEIKLTGLRTGEKLHERLRFDFERAEPTAHPLILRLTDDLRVWSPRELSDTLQQLRLLLHGGDNDAAKEALFTILSQTGREDTAASDIAASAG